MIKRRLLGLMLLSALLFCFPAFAAQRALLVGCDQFVSRPSTAPSSENNLMLMTSLLSGSRPSPDRVESRLNSLVTDDDLRLALVDAFSGATEQDISWIYFSTHGLIDENGEMALLLSDGVREDQISASALREMLDSIPGQKHLILDACYSGAAIGKGLLPEQATNAFLGSGCQVLCSSGGAEESWFWSGAATGGTGAGYFTGVLSLVMGRDGCYMADADRDGVITLSELKSSLRSLHGLSTVHCYPENDKTAFLTYDADEARRLARRGVFGAVSFDDSVLTPDAPYQSYSFTLLHATRIACQLVCLRQGRWDFSDCEILPDAPDDTDTWPVSGALDPGMYRRDLVMPLARSGSSGYALLQLLAYRNNVLMPVASHILCVPPTTGDPCLGFSCPESFSPIRGEELGLVIFHAFPCELTVCVENAAGETVRWLCNRAPTRPEGLSPEGSFFCWDGRDQEGNLLSAGEYRVRVSAYVGSERYSLTGPIFRVIP